MTNKEKLIITGSNGLVGRGISNELKEKYYLIGLSKSDNTNPYIDEFYKINILDMKIVKDIFLDKFSQYNIKTIIHSAATITYGKSKKQQKQISTENVTGTENIVSSAKLINIEKFINIGSIVELGLHKGVADEDSYNDYFINTFPYANSKCLSKKIIEKEYPNYINLLLGSVFGDDIYLSSMGKMIDLIARRKIPMLPNGIIAVTDSRDIGKVIDLYLIKSNEKDINGEYIIISGNYTYKYISELIAKNLNIKPPKIIAPNFLILLGGIFSDIYQSIFNKDFFLTKTNAQIVTSKLEYNNKKAIEILNFLPRDIKETIEFAVNCYIKYLRK